MYHCILWLKCQCDWSWSGLVMKLGGGDAANITLSFVSQTSQSVRLITAEPKGGQGPTLLLTFW